MNFPVIHFMRASWQKWNRGKEKPLRETTSVPGSRPARAMMFVDGLKARNDLLQNFLRNVWSTGIFGGMADDQNQEWLFLCRTFQYPVEKAHWTRCMSQCEQSGHVDRGNQHSRGNTDRLCYIVVFYFTTAGRESIGLSKDHDQVRSCFEIRLVLVSAQRCQGIQPLLRSATVVKEPLFLLGSGPDLVFDFRIADHNEVPRLHIGAARSAPCHAQAIVDYLPVNRPLGELTHGAAPKHFVAEPF